MERLIERIMMMIMLLFLEWMILKQFNGKCVFSEKEMKNNCFVKRRKGEDCLLRKVWIIVIVKQRVINLRVLEN